MENKVVEEKKRGLEVTPAMLVIALAAVVGLALFAWLTFAPGPPPAAKPVLTPEAKAYLPHLQLSEVQPQTSESYVQTSLFEIPGKITNTGARTVKDVRVTCVFRDYYGREVKRELVNVVSPASGLLSPNATKSFRLAFDDLPKEWNRQMPDFVIAEIGFQ